MQKNFITLGQAAQLAPTRPSANAVWRWCRRGLKARSGKRVYLKHVRVGGRVFTTAEDVNRFFVELAEADREHFEAPSAEAVLTRMRRTEEQRKDATARAEAELQRQGC